MSTPLVGPPLSVLPSRGGENHLSQKLYVGNLPWATTGEDLNKMFAEVGEVEDAVIISYKDTGRSKGFGFVTMKEDAAADEAIKKFSGFEIEGRALIVDKARPMREDGEGGGEAPASGEAPAAEKTPAA